MIPTNKEQGPCNHISSNCVIWQGPDIPCIDLCNGDSISDVIAKLAEELCAIIDATCLCEPDMSSIDLSCLSDEDPGTLQEVIQQIIDYLCAQSGGTPVEIIIPLPPCLSDGLTDPLGNPITELPVDEYAMLLANEICNILTAIAIINQSIIDLDNRVTILENASGGSGSPLPQVLPTCVLPQNLTNIDVLLVALEQAYCAHVTLVGTLANLSAAIGAQCVLDNDPILSGTGVYSGLPGWQVGAGTLAQSHINLWLALCDIKNAVIDIQNNCCDTGCDTLTLGYTTNLIQAGGVTTDINFNFQPSIVPAGYVDCAPGSQITISDGTNTVTSIVSVQALQNSIAGIDVSIAGLNNASAIYTVTVDFCLTDGTNTCQESQTATVSNVLSCPSPITITQPASYTIQFDFNSDNIGFTYNVDVVDPNTNATVATQMFNGIAAGAPIIGTFNGLTSGYTYNLVITVSNSVWFTTTCPAEVFTVNAVACASFNDLPAAFVNGVGGTLYIGDWYDAGGVQWYSINIGLDVSNDPQVIKTAIGAPGAPAIAGTSLNSNEITCDAVVYTGAASEKWYIVDAFTTPGPGSQVYYVHALWEEATNDLIEVVFCCECPTYILDDFEFVTSGTAVFQPTVVTFGAAPTFTVIQNPLYGTVVQTGAAPAEFTYTPLWFPVQSDSFVIECTSDCGTSSSVMKLMGPKMEKGNVGRGTDVYVWFDTNNVLAADGALIKTAIDTWYASIQLANPGYVGSLYYVALAGARADRYLRNIQAIVDDGVTVAGDLSVDPAWTILMNLPTSWSGGADVQKSDVYNMFFGNEANPNYSGISLAAGWVVGAGVQPTPEYLDDAEAFIDMINGTKKSSWAQALNIQYPYFGSRFAATIMPEIIGAVGINPAYALQAWAAITGYLIPAQEYNGRPLANDMALSGLLLAGDAALPNPYEGAFLPGGDPLLALKAFNWFADLDYSSTDPVYSDPYFSDKLDDFGFNPISEITESDYYILEECGGPSITTPEVSMVNYVNQTIDIGGTCYNVTKTDIPGAAPVPGAIIAAYSSCDCCAGVVVSYELSICGSGTIYSDVDPAGFFGIVPGDVFTDAGASCYTFIGDSCFPADSSITPTGGPFVSCAAAGC